MEKFINYYNSPLGRIALSSDKEYLTGLWFVNSKGDLKHDLNLVESDLKIFDETKKWLDIYFTGQNPSFIPKYKFEDLTPFKRRVFDILNEIPYGKVITYNDIAQKIAKEKNIKRMSAQAVGHAVGSNPICLIVPCHRVIGKNGNLTGYGGGIENKMELLKLEDVDTTKMFIKKEY